MKQVNLDIGNRIKYYREKAHLTQEELSAKVGYNSKSSIYMIEKGMVAVPYEKLTEIAKVLNVSEVTLRYGDNPSMVDIMLKESSVMDKETKPRYASRTDYTIYKKASEPEDGSITFTAEMLEQIPYGDVKRIMEYYNRLKG